MTTAINIPETLGLAFNNIEVNRKSGTFRVQSTEGTEKEQNRRQESFLI